MRFSSETLENLSSYDFPGNIRELQGLVESAFYENVDKTIPSEKLEIPIAPANSEIKESHNGTKIITLEELKSYHIKSTLERLKTKKEAARALGISARQLYNYLDKYHLQSGS